MSKTEEKGTQRKPQNQRKSSGKAGREKNGSPRQYGEIFRTLTRRNASRSFRDYRIYTATLTAVSALMFAFHSLMFPEDILKLCEDGGLFIGSMIGAAAFFIVFILSLIHI